MKSYIPYIITNLAFALLIYLGASLKITFFTVLLYGYAGFVLAMALQMQQEKFMPAVLATFSRTWFRVIDLIYDYAALVALFLLQEPIVCVLYTLHVVLLQLAYYRAKTKLLKDKHENLR